MSNCIKCGVGQTCSPVICKECYGKLTAKLASGNDCFVLRPDRDPAAVAALRAYAAATDNKELAGDIIQWVGEPDNKALTVELSERAMAVRYGVADMLEAVKIDAEFDDPSIFVYGIDEDASELLAAIIRALNVGRTPESW